MKIDKTRFLFLTGALSAAALAGMSVTSGCTVNSTSTDGGTDSSTNNTTDGSTSTDGSASTDGSTDGSSSSDGGADAAACLDDTGSVADCGDAGSCTCATESSLFKKGVANAIAECQLKLPTCEGDPASATCIRDAITRACDDATAAAFCAPLVADCANGAGQKLVQADCEKLVKSLSAAGRAQVTSCVTEGVPNNCGTDSNLCVALP
ncbi:MAG: hypothetical protein KC657_00500 [Myxococcales bacterium]|nr:hypothetical protein [Myxococcales bacterium]